MNKKIEFINYIKPLVNEDDMSDEVRAYWEAFQQTNEKEKPLFTENGKAILKFLQEHSEVDMWPAKKIAEELDVSSRSVAGSIRKLVSNEYVEKLGENPCCYKITEKGKETIVD